MSMRLNRWRPVTATVAAAALLVTAAPAFAAFLDDWEVTGIQFVNADCSRNEYVVNAAFTGTTDDGGGFDKMRVEVWDDGELKDFRVLEVPVGYTYDTTSFLSFVGTYLSGAPGVGIYLSDADSAGEVVTSLDFEDPYFPEDQEGPCSFDVERIGGADRIETAALLAQRFIMADTVVVATSGTFPDALSAAPLADQVAGPLLLTRPAHLPAKTVAEVTRLQPSHIIVIGGAAAVNDSVLTDLEALVPGTSVTRVAGSHRYATSAAVAGLITQDSTAQVFLATGEDFPDALVLSALAARENAPLVLARHDSVPGATQTFLESATYDDLYAAGGTGVLSDAVLTEAAGFGGATVTRYQGPDRYETAAAVLAQFPPEGRVMVATGEAFPDALTSVPVAGRTGAGIALSRTDAVPASAVSEITRLTTGFSYPLISVIGGEAALSEDVFNQLLTLVGASAELRSTQPPVTEMTSNHPSDD